MKLLYVTANVLGDDGANAAELFPRMAVLSSKISAVWVADYDKNKHRITQKQFAQFLRLRRQKEFGLYPAFRNALRIAKKSKDEGIDVVHIFYRQANNPLVSFLRIALIILRCHTKILVDHRSVNLARGSRGFFKKISNQFMQIFAHQLAGNPLAVETNHFFIFKPKNIIDLGYSQLPEGNAIELPDGRPISVWFIGSMRPKNRKSEFLIDVLDELEKRFSGDSRVVVRVAGPADQNQIHRLNQNSLVRYYGRLSRSDLYHLLRQNPGIGIAYMNEQFHWAAPSLKFCEYAIMRFKIVASNTVGLQTQAKRLKFSDVIFAEETVVGWADKLTDAIEDWSGITPEWNNSHLWSYESIFSRQVLEIYRKLIANA